MAKILLVEDDNNLREIYEARLQAEGYEIVAAKDGEEALSVAMKERPDLIISDVMMPKISGFDMLDIIRSTEETKNTKVIMMTALSQAEDKDRANKLGADRYLVKSQVTLEDVAKVAREVLGDDSAGIPHNPPESTAVKPVDTSSTTPAAVAPVVNASAKPANPTPVVVPTPTPAPAAPTTPAVLATPSPVASATTPTPVPTPAPAPAPAAAPTTPAAPAPVTAPSVVAAPVPTPAPAVPTTPTAPKNATEVTETPTNVVPAPIDLAAGVPHPAPTKASSTDATDIASTAIKQDKDNTDDEKSAIASQIESFIGSKGDKQTPPASIPKPSSKTDTTEPSTTTDATRAGKPQKAPRKTIEPISKETDKPDLQALLKIEEEKEQAEKNVAAPAATASQAPQPATAENTVNPVAAVPVPISPAPTESTQTAAPQADGTNIDGVVNQQTTATDDPNLISL